MERKCSLMHFQAQTSRLFLKITLSLPKHVAPCRSEPPLVPASCRLPVRLTSCAADAGMLERGVPIPSLGRDRAFATYESNVLFTLRFMVDCGIGGGYWMEIPAGKWIQNKGTPKTYCQLEADVHFRYVWLAICRGG